MEENLNTLSNLNLDLPGHYSGKVRESWPVSQNRRILVTTDRLSAFDRIIGLVENKGQVLNQLSAWWFDKTNSIVPNHLIEVPDPNVSVALDAKPLQVEVVMRSRLTGSTSTSILPRYLAGERNMYGYDFPDGLTPHCELPEHILTPTTKAQDGGHDEPITVDQVLELGILEPQIWERVQKIAHELFQFGFDHASSKGFVLADTKYEFGLAPSGEIILIDEVHTPDSSRYWLKDGLDDRLAAGQGPQNFDKEPVRLALREAGYCGDGQIPVLEDKVWEDASQRYTQIYEAMTGQIFEPGERPISKRIESNLAPYIDEVKNSG